METILGILGSGMMFAALLAGSAIVVAVLMVLADHATRRGRQEHSGS